MSYYYVYYLPFYNKNTNIAEALRFGLLAWGGVAQIVSYLEDEEPVLIVLMIFAFPVMYLITNELVKKRIQYVCENSRETMNELSDIYSCELGIRYIIYDFLEAKRSKDNNLKAEIEAELEKCFKNLDCKFGDKKLQFIWIFLYYYHIRKNEIQAGLKLSFVKDTKFDIECSFLHYKYSRTLEDLSKNDIADIEFLKYLDLYNEAKYYDSEVCLTLLKFWDELMQNQPRFHKLENLAIKLHKELNLTLEKCKVLYERYPNNRKVCNLYGSFLLNVCNDHRKGQEILIKVENFKSGLESGSRFIALDQITYIDENIGVLLISGDSRSLGNITFMNQAAVILLETPPNASNNNHFSIYCPPPLNDKKSYNEKLRIYLERKEFTNIPVPSESYMVTSNGYLIEVYIEVRCLAYNSQPLFICTLRKLDEVRECAILSEFDLIQAHTKGFRDIIGEETYIHLDIKEVIPDFENLNYTQMVEYNNYRKGTKFYARLEVHMIGSMGFRVLYLSSFRQADVIAASVTSQFSSENIGFKKSKTILNVIFDNKISLTQAIFLNHLQNIQNHFPPTKKLHFNQETKSPIEDSTSPRQISLYSQSSNLLDSPKASSIQNTPFDIEVLTIENTSNSVKNKSISQSNVSISSAILTSTVISLLNILKKSIFRLKLYSFITIVSVILGIITITIYVLYISYSFQQSALVKELSDVRSYTILQSANVRALQLVAEGYISIDYEDIIRSNTYNHTVKLSKFIKDLEKKIHTWSVDNQKYILNTNINVWYLQANRAQQQETRLLDALKNLAKSTMTISQLPLGNITFENSDFYYAFMNGHGETLRILNETVYSFIDREERDLLDIVSVVEAICVSAMCFILLGSAAIFLPSLISVESCQKNIWKYYFKIKNSALSQMKINSQERLETLHLMELNLHCDSTKRDLNTHKKKFRYKSRWLNLLLRLALNCVISIIFIGFFYYWICVKYVGILSEKPIVENWAGMRVLAVEGSFFWYYESIFEYTETKYFNIVNEYQSIASENNELRRYQDILKYSESKLVNGPLAGQGMTDQNYKLLFEDGRTESYNSTILSRGVHSGISEYIFILNDQGTYMPNYQVWKYKDALGYTLIDLVKDYEQQFEKELDSIEEILIWATVSYCIFSVLVYFMVYIPIINKLRARISQIWELSRLIPASLLD